MCVCTRVYIRHHQVPLIDAVSHWGIALYAFTVYHYHRSLFSIMRSWVAVTCPVIDAVKVGFSLSHFILSYLYPEGQFEQAVET